MDCKLLVKKYLEKKKHVTHILFKFVLANSLPSRFVFVLLPRNFMKKRKFILQHEFNILH